MDCIFCKIINKEVPSNIVYETDQVVAFHDINPQAPTHVLFVPKQHIGSVAAEGAEDAVRDLIKAAKEFVAKNGFLGYKLVFNVGREAGQTVGHLHMHFLAAKEPGTLPSQLSV